MKHVVSLPELFHQRVFRVPDYQRGYSWERLQVEQFLEDLELLGPGRYHYTGTVVLHELNSGTGRMDMDEDGNTYVHADIVDGQQRLTTIVLLLDGIRRKLASLSDESKQPETLASLGMGWRVFCRSGHAALAALSGNLLTIGNER